MLTLGNMSQWSMKLVTAARRCLPPHGGRGTDRWPLSPYGHQCQSGSLSPLPPTLWNVGTAPKGCRGTLGREDDQDAAATKFVFWRLAHKNCGKHTHVTQTHAQHYSPPDGINPQTLKASVSQFYGSLNSQWWRVCFWITDYREFQTLVELCLKSQHHIWCWRNSFI